MLSRHLCAHNLNVSEMRLLFSLRCADPGIFVRGGGGVWGGGVSPTARKQPQQRFFSSQMIFTVLQRGSNILQVGVQMLMLIATETHITCNFSEGGGGPDPLPPL